ncbi:MAG: DNA mismatch repair endonuclease MutL [Planctomycetota bacterium]|jgi:DNA mismatch repair protein MutL
MEGQQRPSSIQLLRPEVARKISAGEVIERPSSVVKELVENSIDAGSTRIDVEVAEGGKTLIRVTDDGIGIAPEDLEKVFLKHATSKISAMEDLEIIDTMGFRGEALASIGAVSMARIVSCARGSGRGAEIEVRGGDRQKRRYVGAPEGTQVEVKELFYNVPARRKFLKSTTAEMSHISEVLTRLALSHPEVHFVFSHNSREVFNLPSASSLKDRVATYYGGELAGDLICVNSREQGLEVAGYTLAPTHHRTNTRMQYIFLNGRPIRDPGLTHAVNNAYRTLLPPGRFPVVFLSLKIDPSYVDVNVHPTKMEVRFREASRVYGLLLQGIKKALTQFQPGLTPVHRPDSRTVAAPLSSHSVSAAYGPGASSCAGDGVGVAGQLLPKAHAAAPRVEDTGAGRGRFIQLHSAYIVEESPKGINIIDQHALHEAVLYHEIKSTIREKPLSSQRLLIPELVELSHQDFFRILELRETLERLGLELEEFGSNSVIVRALPQLIKDVDIKELIKELVEGAEEGSSCDQVLDRAINVMACRGAVKSGDRLNAQELAALLERRKVDLPHAHCPHGRPTTLFFPLEELDRQFKRTGK